MNWKERKEAIIQWGKMLQLVGSETEWPGYESGLAEDEFKSFQQAIVQEERYNGWFTEESVRKSLLALAGMMSPEKVDQWLSAYASSFEREKSPKRIGVVMAGNLPLVGFHDLLCVFAAGHHFIGKLSSQDQNLLPHAVGLLTATFPELKDWFVFAEDKLSDFDAVVATGSNNTARYFEYYFANYPHIIRKNRQSVAIIDGSETEEELKALGEDVFSYYGLGCRNVSKLFLPEGYDAGKLFEQWQDFEGVVNNHKYRNNYDYHKSIFLLNKDEFLDNGFVMMMKKEPVASPMAALHYANYESQSDLSLELKSARDEIQCVVGHNQIPFGQSQKPELWEYADGVDTMDFLLNTVYSSNS